MELEGPIVTRLDARVACLRILALPPSSRLNATEAYGSKTRIDIMQPVIDRSEITISKTRDIIQPC